MDNEYQKVALGLKIKSFRNDRNQTQEEFSGAIGLEQSNLSNIENGKTFPDITTLCSIIQKMNLEPNFLLDFLLENKEKYTSIDYEILEILTSLPLETKAHLKELLLTQKTNNS